LFEKAFSVPLKKRHIEKYANEWILQQKQKQIEKEALEKA